MERMIPDYVQRQIADVEDVSLYWPRTALVDVIKPTGFTVGGLYADHNAGNRKVHVNDNGEDYDVDVAHEYYPVLARVLKVHECREVKPGDVVRFTAMNYEDAETADGRIVMVMYEKCMMAVIEGFDEAAIFYSEAAA